MAYGRLEESPEVIDVLYALLQGFDTPKKIQKKLKQDGSVVRMKLQFLRKNKVVIKDRWNYKPDWDRISIVMCRTMSSLLKERIKSRRISTKVYFKPELLKGIIRVYSAVYFAGYDKLSFRQMAEMFLDSMSHADGKRLEKLNPKLVKLKEILRKKPTKEEMLIDKLVTTYG
jgi:hypothetical protein